MNNLRGILFMALSMAFFAVEDLFIKIVSDELPYAQIALTLGTLPPLIFWALCRREGVTPFHPVLRHPAMLMRIGAEAVGFSSLIIALALAPLALVSAIVQATPLLIAAGASMVYGEHVGPYRWTAIGLGFVGVLIVLRPGLDGFDPNALFAIVATLGLAVRDLATRPIPKHVPNVVLSFWGFAAMLPSAFVLWLVGDGLVVPSFEANWMMVIVVATGMLGYATITISLRSGDMSVIVPFRYVRLIYALLLAALFLGERPDGLVLLGSALIVASGIFTILREARLRKRTVILGQQPTKP
jgi:drug/metabolite transporter (DMT)-like permease